MATRVTEQIRISAGPGLQRFADDLGMSRPLAEYVNGIKDALGIPANARYRLVIDGALVLVPDPPLEYDVPEPDLSTAEGSPNGSARPEGDTLARMRSRATGGD